MDRRERLDDGEEGLRVATTALQARMWTAMPGLIQSFNAEALTCVVQPAIQGVVNDRDGNRSPTDLPLLLDCPVVFPGGGGMALSFPLKPGDECLVVFASRCIDSWWQSGGVQAQAELRMHDLSDGFVLPGVRSQARRFTASVTATELRTDDGALLLRMHPGSGVISLVAPVGGVHVDGTLTVTGDVIAGNVSLMHHVHSGVQAGSDLSGQPVP